MVALAIARDTPREELMDMFQGLPSMQARVDRAERWRTNHRFGDLDAPQLASIIEQAKRGDVAEWADCAEYMATTDADVFSLYVTRVVRVAQADYIISPNPYGMRGKDALSSVAEQAADFCDAQYGRIRQLQDARCKLLHAHHLGYSVGEMAWQRDRSSKTNYVHHITHVHSHRMRYDMQWKLRLYDQGSKQGPKDALGYGQMLDPRTMIPHLQQEIAGYPGIGGCAIAVAWPWLFGRWVEKYRLHYLEHYGSPFKTGTVPKGSTLAVRQKMQQCLDQMTAEHNAVTEDGSTITVNSNGASTNSDESFDRYEQQVLRRKSKVYLGTSDAVDPGVNGSKNAVETRAGAAMDPRMISDGVRLCDTEVETILTRLIYENAHKFSVPIEQVPIPLLRLKTADDEVKRDQTDKNAEVRAEVSAGDRPYEVQGPAANDNAAAAREAAPAVAPAQMSSGDVPALIALAENVRAGKLSASGAVAMMAVVYPHICRDDAMLIVAGDGPPTEMSAVPKARPLRRGTKATGHLAPTSPLAMALRGESATSTRSPARRSPKP